MKKINVLLIILSLAVTLSLFGCEKNAPAENGQESIDPSTLIGPVSIFDGGMTFYIDINETSVAIYEDGSFDAPYQNFAHAGLANIEASKSGFSAVDLNFDGYLDLTVPQRTVDGIQYYYGYLWSDESKTFSFNSDILNIGNLTVGDKCLLSTEIHNGKEMVVEYYFEDGKLVHEHVEDDPLLVIAETYMKGFLKKDGIEALFTSWELIDNAICKKYFILEGDNVIASAAVNATGERVFYSPVTDSYYEITTEGEEYLQSDKTYGKIPHVGVIFTYVNAAYESLSDEEKVFYNKIYNDITTFTANEYTEENALKIVEAVLADYPELRNYFRYTERGGIVNSSFFVKGAPYKEVVPDEINAAMDEYDAFAQGIIDTMPVGLEPEEKYIFLAQRLLVLTKEHSEHEPSFGKMIQGDSKGEQLSRTFKFLCEKAQIYCTTEGNKNTILIDAEYVTIGLEDTFNYVPGSDKWMEQFYDED